MKNLFLFAGVILAVVCLISSCSQRQIVVEDKNGNRVEATVSISGEFDLPSVENQDWMNVGVMKHKLSGGFVYSGQDWEMSDTTAIFGLVQREIFIGKIVARE